jgi:hypothetical protein
MEGERLPQVCDTAQRQLANMMQAKLGVSRGHCPGGAGPRLKGQATLSVTWGL